MTNTIQAQQSAALFETSEQTDKLDEALAKVQGELNPAIKDSLNPHFKSKYADLASVVDAARAALSKYSVSVTQWPTIGDNGWLTIVTRIAHSGQWMRSTFSIPVTKHDAQGYGSAITYARRFTYMAALSIAPEEDDDGNAASQRSQVLPQAHARGNVAPRQNNIGTADSAKSAARLPVITPIVDPIPPHTQTVGMDRPAAQSPDRDVAEMQLPIGVVTATENPAANYVLKIGQHAGKRIVDVPEFHAYFTKAKEAATKKKPTPDWAEAIAAYDEYCIIENEMNGDRVL